MRNTESAVRDDTEINIKCGSIELFLRDTDQSQQSTSAKSLRLTKEGEEILETSHIFDLCFVCCGYTKSLCFESGTIFIKPLSAENVPS